MNAGSGQVYKQSVESRGNQGPRPLRALYCVEEELKYNSLLNRKPVEINKDRCNVFSPWFRLF